MIALHILSAKAKTPTVENTYPHATKLSSPYKGYKETIENTPNSIQYYEAKFDDVVTHLISLGYSQQQAIRDCVEYGREELAQQIENLYAYMRAGKSFHSYAKWLNWAIRSKHRRATSQIVEPETLVAADAPRSIDEEYVLITDEDGYSSYQIKQSQQVQTVSQSFAIAHSTTVQPYEYTDAKNTHQITLPQPTHQRPNQDDGGEVATLPIAPSLPASPAALGAVLSAIDHTPTASRHTVVLCVCGQLHAAGEAGGGICVKNQKREEDWRKENRSYKEQKMRLKEEKRMMTNEGLCDYNRKLVHKPYRTKYRFQASEDIPLHQWNIVKEMMDGHRRLAEPSAMPQSEARPRKQRSDKGLVKRTERDEWILNWIGEMMTVRLDQVQKLLGRDPQAPTQQQGIVKPTTAKDVVRRWESAGLIESRVIYHKKPAFLWLTGRGQQEMGLPYKKPFSGKTEKLRHYYYVNEARLYIENKYGSAAVWTSERHIVARKQAIHGHFVDGRIVLHENDGTYTYGVEVEISTKSEERTIAILQSLAAEYDNIAYFVLHDTMTSVTNRIKQLSPNDQEGFTIINLEDTF